MDVMKNQRRTVSFYLNGEFWTDMKFMAENVTEVMNLSITLNESKDDKETLSFEFHRVMNKRQSFWQYHASNAGLKVKDGEIVRV